MKLEMNVYQRKIIEFAREHPKVLVLSADLGSSCEIKEFQHTYPERYFSLGIAEQNMVSWAAGLAREGFRPILHSFGVFLYRRVLDQLEMSVAYPNLPVIFLGFLPGIMTPGGVTHQAIDDVAALRSVPNMTILDVGDATDIESVLDVAYAVNGPVFIRMLRKEVPRLFPEEEPMRLNSGRLLSDGDDVAVFTSDICTEEALRAAAVMRKRGVSVRHVHVSTLKPFTDDLVLESLKKARYGAVSMENHLTVGGLGSALSEMITDNGLNCRLLRVGLRDTFTHGASKMYLMKKYGIDAAALISAVEELLGRSLGIDEAELEEMRYEDYSAV